MLALFPVCLEDPIEDPHRGVMKVGVDAPFTDEGLARTVARHGEVILFGSNPHAFVVEREGDQGVRKAFRSVRTFLAETLTREPRWDRVPPAMESAVDFAAANREVSPDGEWARTWDELSLATAMVQFMSDCSEERICAGWDSGNGVTLWRQLHAEGDEDGMGGSFTDDDRQALRNFCRGGYWWEWFDDDGLRPVPISDWQAGRVCFWCGRPSDVRGPGENDETYAACRDHLRPLAWYVRGGAATLAREAHDLWFQATLPRRRLDSFWAALRALVTEAPAFDAAGVTDVYATRVELDPVRGDGLRGERAPDAVLVTYAVDFPFPRGGIETECATYRLPFVAEGDAPLDPAAAWERLATAGAIPSTWVSDPQRRFECPTCHGAGTVRGGSTAGGDPGDSEVCDDCAREDLDATGGVVAEGTLAHPPTLAAVFALASGVAGVTQAEELARDFYRRVCALEPAREGSQAVLRMRERTVPVVWRVGPYEAGRKVSRQELHVATAGLSEAEGAAFLEALLPAWLWLSPGSPLLAPCPERADAARENVPHPLRRLYDRVHAWPESLGPNPWMPLYTLWSEGYRFEEVAPGGLFLACDGFPVAHDPRSNRAHG